MRSSGETDNVDDAYMNYGSESLIVKVEDPSTCIVRGQACQAVKYGFVCRPRPSEWTPAKMTIVSAPEFQSENWGEKGVMCEWMEAR